METRLTDEDSIDPLSFAGLRGILSRQDGEVIEVNKKLDKLENLPADLKILTERVANLVEYSKLLHEIHNIQTGHALALKIIGAVSLACLPMLTLWNVRLQSELTALQTDMVRVETRLEVRKP